MAVVCAAAPLALANQLPLLRLYSAAGPVTAQAALSYQTFQPVLAGNHREGLDDLIGAKFYWQHALAEGNYCIWITEKMLEVMLKGVTYVSPYQYQQNHPGFSYTKVPV